jgi:DNA-directed RNA polymerase specialized sigma24 family protein
VVRGATLSADLAERARSAWVSGEASRRAARDAAVEDACERRHTLLALAAALADMDSSSADVVRLKAARASWPAVATMLGISVSTARRVHAKATQQMRRSLTAAGVSIGCEVGDGGLFASNPVAEAEQAA